MNTILEMVKKMMKASINPEIARNDYEFLVLFVGAMSNCPYARTYWRKSVASWEVTYPISVLSCADTYVAVSVVLKLFTHPIGTL